MQPPSAGTDPAEAFRARLAQPWRVLETGAGPAAWNMALDEALLLTAAREGASPTLRFYRWSPFAVSLGRFQQAEGIDLPYAADRGWHAVRRITGGRAVLHALEVTYSLALPPSVVGGAGVRAAYAVLCGCINAGLGTLLGAAEAACSAGAAVPGAARQASCFALAAVCDTLVPQGKLVGSAQIRRDGALLQHGSILLDAQPEHWAALFGEAGNLGTLRSALGRTPDPAEVHAAVMAGFRTAGVRFAPGALTAREAREAEERVPQYLFLEHRSPPPAHSPSPSPSQRTRAQRRPSPSSP